MPAKTLTADDLVNAYRSGGPEKAAAAMTQALPEVTLFFMAWLRGQSLSGARATMRLYKLAWLLQQQLDRDRATRGMERLLHDVTTDASRRRR